MRGIAYRNGPVVPNMSDDRMEDVCRFRFHNVCGVCCRQDIHSDVCNILFWGIRTTKQGNTVQSQGPWYYGPAFWTGDEDTHRLSTCQLFSMCCMLTVCTRPSFWPSLAEGACCRAASVLPPWNSRCKIELIFGVMLQFNVVWCIHSRWEIVLTIQSDNGKQSYKVGGKKYRCPKVILSQRPLQTVLQRLDSETRGILSSQRALITCSVGAISIPWGNQGSS